MKRLSIITMAAAVLFLASCSKVPQLKHNNIDKVIAAMTLEEKAQLLAGIGAAEPDDTLAASAYRKVPGAAGATYPIPRLGIPSVVFADGPAGVHIAQATTQFPTGTALASSWDDDLVQDVGEAIGSEALDCGVDLLLAPAMNIQRDPLCGRNFEYYSEDPLISGKMAAAFVRGVQSKGVGSTLKHFAANNQETARRTVNACVTPRALREIYLRGFDIAIKQSSPWIVTAAMNRINGFYVSEWEDLLTSVLRDEWGFEGMVMSDWRAGTNPPLQMSAGNDLLMPGMPGQVESIVRAVRNGTLSEEILDRNVRRVLQMIVRTATFNDKYRSGKPELEKHARLARRSGADGNVLLINKEHTLPIQDTSATVILYGEASYNTLPGGTGSGSVDNINAVSLADGLTNAGLTITDDPSMASMAIVTISRQSGESTDRPLSDFYLSSDEKKMIAKACALFHPMDKKVVVVLNIDAPVETESWKDQPDAILLAWQGGQEAGNSIADVLTGKVNPSGKLTMTFPIDYSSCPTSSNFPVDMGLAAPGMGTRNVDYTFYQEGIYVGYRFYDTFGKNVSFPFGHGLSYTSFEYDEPEVVEKKKTIKVFVKVTNNGDVAGREVVQLYAREPSSSLEKPVQELKSYRKTRLLEPGESEEISFTIPIETLASFNESSSTWSVDAGTYIMRLGSSSRDIRAEAAVHVDGARFYPSSDVLTLDRAVNELHTRTSIFRERFKPQNGMVVGDRPEELDVNGSNISLLNGQHANFVPDFEIDDLLIDLNADLGIDLNADIELDLDDYFVDPLKNL